MLDGDRSKNDLSAEFLGSPKLSNLIQYFTESVFFYGKFVHEMNNFNQSIHPELAFFRI